MLSAIGVVPKGWGEERIYRSSPYFCRKDLVFNKVGNKCSMHYHKTKYEEFVVISGSFLYEWAYGNINSHEAFRSRVLNTGDTVYIEPYTLHRMTALADNSIIEELSIADHVEDSIRVLPGDSQSQGV